MSYNDTVSTEAEQGPTHMLIHRQDTHTHHRNYSHTARVYSKQSGRGPQGPQLDRLANVESAAQLHMDARRQSSQKRAQPQFSPGRVGSARQCRPRAAGIRATPAARAGMHLLRQLASIC